MRHVLCLSFICLSAFCLSAGAGDAKKNARVKELQAEIKALEAKLAKLKSELASLSPAVKDHLVDEISFDVGGIKAGYVGPFKRVHQFFEVLEVIDKKSAILSPKNTRAFVRVLMEGHDTGDWADGAVVELGGENHHRVLGTKKRNGSTHWHIQVVD